VCGDLEESTAECAYHLQLGVQVREVNVIEDLLIKKKFWRSVVSMYVLFVCYQDLQSLKLEHL